MANTGLTAPQELLDDFDDAINLKKARGELPRNASRSYVLRELMKEFIEETKEGNPKTLVAPMAD